MAKVPEFLVKMQHMVSDPLSKVTASLTAAQAKAQDFNKTLHHTGSWVNNL